LVNFGVLCVTQSRPSEAQQAFERAITASPGYAPAHLHLAEMIQAEGRTQGAIAQYQRCAQMAAAAGNKELVAACEIRAQALSR
jgi:Tfp pilus assembly protein PilF